MPERYIGDSVYVCNNLAGQLQIYTNNGYGPQNVIILEPEVLNDLIRFALEHGFIASDVLARLTET